MNSRNCLDCPIFHAPLPPLIFAGYGRASPLPNHSYSPRLQHYHPHTSFFTTRPALASYTMPTSPRKFNLNSKVRPTLSFPTDKSRTPLILTSLSDSNRSFGSSDDGLSPLRLCSNVYPCSQAKCTTTSRSGRRTDKLEE